MTLGSRRARALLVLAALSVAGVIAFGVNQIVQQRRLVEEMRGLQDQVYSARVSVDSCRHELAYQERLFRHFDAVVDSLRGQVRDFEKLDARGVPEDRYDEYMEHFDGYNDSVAAWRAKADSLRATDARCRTLIEQHNSLADSLRGRLQKEGIAPVVSGGGNVARPDSKPHRSGPGLPVGGEPRTAPKTTATSGWRRP